MNILIMSEKDNYSLLFENNIVYIHQLQPVFLPSIMLLERWSLLLLVRFLYMYLSSACSGCIPSYRIKLSSMSRVKRTWLQMSSLLHIHITSLRNAHCMESIAYIEHIEHIEHTVIIKTGLCL